MPGLTLKLLVAVLAMSFTVSATAQGAVEAGGDIIVQIDDLIIREAEFQGIFRAAVRQKYYHGRVPAEELAKFKQRVAQDIVIQVLVHRDAQKRGLQPDREAIAAEIDEYDAKYASSPGWDEQRARVVPLLTRRLERQNLLTNMETQIKNIPQPQPDLIARYYRDHPEKFTQPARVWGSAILLAVPPSADAQMWTEAMDVALQLKFRVENGEEFESLAKQYSGHASAVNGGDLGYLHQGMLASEVQQQVDALEINAITDPTRVLEGVILFRLNGVQPEAYKSFDEVRQRATALLYRELQAETWNSYLSELKAAADIKLNEMLTVRSN